MIHSFVFSEGKMVGQGLDLDALKLFRGDKGLFIWVDLDCPTPDETEKVLAGVFGFHPLAIEDCITESSRPKLEDYEEYFFLTMHAVDFNRTDSFQTTELDCFVGKDYLVTYHTRALRSVKAMVDRCLNRVVGVIARGPDRLLHQLLDQLVDNYQPVLEEFIDQIDEIEEALLAQDTVDRSIVAEIVHVRKDLTRLRQLLRPQQEMIHRLARGESKLIRAILLPYYRNLLDNLHRVDEMAGSYAEQLLLAMDLYVNKVAYQTNEGIKVLTALTALTLPPVLIGSWYGMNFTDMPELHEKWGYEMAIGLTLLGMGGVWYWLKRKGWL
jgi:magnesium transporter